jgi:mono/diheme cytochrome c family protein
VSDLSRLSRVHLLAVAPAIAAGACAAALLAGCRTDQTIVTPDPHLERMLDQPKTRAYDPAPLLPGDTAMQTPPDGVMPFAPESSATAASVSLGSLTSTAAMTGIQGGPGGTFVDRIPIPVDRALLATGRARFDVFCAACHGMAGDGVSAVAEQMSLRKPADLNHDARNFPDGRIFQIVRGGWGLMPSYDVQLTVEETWAVVAYVRALQLARRANVRDLPPDVRAELTKEAP